MQCVDFFHQMYSDGLILKSLTWINILAIAQKDVFLKLILNVQNNYENYAMIDKIETKREMLSEHQLKIVNLYNIHIGNVKKLVPNIFDKKNILFIMKTCNLT